MSPLVTVAIPTRNRQICAATLVRAVLDLVPDCQVVVNDNSDDESLAELLKDRLADQRLSYRYQPGMLSVIDNFNFALERATGDFITFLGDDDIIGPYFQEVAAKAKTEGIEAVLYRTCGRVVHYFWPGVTSPRWGDMGGKLYFSNFTGLAAPLDLRKTMRDAILHLSEGPRHMPRIYLGLVSRKLVERVQAKYGNLFGGFSPDVYSSHLIAEECNRAVVVDYPFILPGASPKSTSAAHAGRSDVGSGTTAKEHMGRFSSTNWDARVPKYYSPYTIWSQSLIHAHGRTGTPIPARAFGYLYATCLLFSFHQARNHLGDAIKAHDGGWRRLAVASSTVGCLAQVAVNYVVRRIPAAMARRPGGARHVISGLPETRSALEALARQLGTEAPTFCG